jgi:cell wall-associated NlpC family hydrolase
MIHLMAYAMMLAGTPYKWGGSNPLEGFDCSGFVQEILRAGGIDPEGDQTSQGLYNYFSRNGSYNKYGPGALAFYGENVLKITHVAFCIDDRKCITATGGGPLVMTHFDAAVNNAFVKMRPINHRKDLQAVIMPYYPGRI